MAAGSQCCCLHVKTCAIIVAIIGIIFSGLQCISALLLWWYLPFSIMMFCTYILVLVGATKGRPGYLLPAEIIMGISVALSCLVIIGLIVLGAIIPQSFIDTYRDDYPNDSIDDAKNAFRIVFFMLAFMVLVASSYTIFSFVVIRRARRWLSENETNCNLPHSYPHAYTVAAPPQHVYHGNPPPQQYNPGPQGYQQQPPYPRQQQQYSPQPPQQYPPPNYPLYNPTPSPHPSPQPAFGDSKW
jgi:hypothetical protein